MTCFNGRVPIEIMDKIVDLMDGESLLSFEQTSKPNQGHVQEAFERKQHLQLDSRGQANQSLLRCGPNLRTVDHPSHMRSLGFGAYFNKMTQLGHETLPLEYLPLRDIVIYCMISDIDK